MNIRRIATLISLVTLSSAGSLTAGCAGTSAAQASAYPVSASDAAGLEAAEALWARSLTSGDPALLATLIDGTFSFIGPDAQFEEREAYLAGYAALTSGDVVVDGIEPSETKLRVYGDVGIVTGRVLAKVRFQGQPVQEDVRFTRVYRREGTGWRMIAGQGTRLPAQQP